MKNAELSEYIRHYLEKDRSKSSIMLTGEWGIGKSYYIQNELVPFLLHDVKYGCVVVSLYGLKTVSEISKSIYLELRIKPLQSSCEAMVAGKLVAKTVAKGVTSFFGIDLSSSETDMQKLYESVDLSRKLIILEDIERSQINILELLGYVNSLVEQDGAKVLLVANESEIKKYNESKSQFREDEHKALRKDTSGNSTQKKLTNESLKYLETKEKTVSDTILFEGDAKAAILQIIKSFDNSILNKFATDESAKDICDIMAICNNVNLRSFIFACQKSVNIFEQIADDPYEGDFIQSIFFGILFFSLRIKAGKTVHWDGGENYSIGLGHEKFPLFKFCYDYIEQQQLDVSQIPIAAEAFAKKQLYDKRKTFTDPDLQTLFNYHIHYEEDVKKAVQSITKRLENPEDISFYDYGAIAGYLVIVENLLGFNIERAKISLVNNLKGRGNELRFEELFRINIRQESASIMEEYEDLRKRMGQSLKENTTIVPEFEYLPVQADIFCNYIVKNYGLYYNQKKFAQNLDIKKLAHMFSQSDPRQKQCIRNAFEVMYHTGNIKQFLADDAPYIAELQNVIATDLEHQEGDKVQKLQYKWFLDNLSEILQRLQ